MGENRKQKPPRPSYGKHIGDIVNARESKSVSPPDSPKWAKKMLKDSIERAALIEWEYQKGLRWIV